jgi:hypothetical protein
MRASLFVCFASVAFVGILVAPSLVEAGCGNGQINHGEECDGRAFGNRTCADYGYNAGDLSCSRHCRIETGNCYNDDPCGNGAIDNNEACDGGNFGGRTCADYGYDGGELGCSDACDAIDTSGCYNNDPCGNGAIDNGETCDGGNVGGRTCTDLGYDGGDLGCADSCNAYDTSNCYNDEPTDECGNGTVDPGEECDGNDLHGKVCGDYGHAGGTLKCNPDCSYDFSDCNSCGDGRIQQGEACDGADLMGATCEGEGYDGGQISCNGSCQLDVSDCNGGSSVCGDGMRDRDESCDGADLAGESCNSLGLGDGRLSCNDTCSFDASGCTDGNSCGDGMVDAEEQCDGADTGEFTCAYFGYRFGQLGCTDGCRLDTSACTNDEVEPNDCGNGVIEPGEECDGTNIGGTYCCGHEGDRPVCMANCQLNFDVCVHGQNDQHWNEGQRPLQDRTDADSGEVPDVPASCSQAGVEAGGNWLRLLLRR